jgi:hypothetical protein
MTEYTIALPLHPVRVLRVKLQDTAMAYEVYLHKAVRKTEARQPCAVLFFRHRELAVVRFSATLTCAFKADLYT